MKLANYCKAVGGFQSSILQGVADSATKRGTSGMCPTLASDGFKLQRRTFNPANSEHIEIYREFKRTGKWPERTSFHLEWPYLSVPATVEAKLIKYALAL